MVNKASKHREKEKIASFPRFYTCCFNNYRFDAMTQKELQKDKYIIFLIGFVVHCLMR